MLIIGSVAMRHHFPTSREPKDIDIIVPGSTGFKRKVGENLLVEQFWDKPMELIYSRKEGTFISDIDLLTLKCSHAGWDVHWEKTMMDIAFLQSNYVGFDNGLYEQLVPMWAEIHGKKRVNTNMSNEEFFSDAVKRKYDHDWLHEQVAFGSSPAYEKIQVDKNSPKCSLELWKEAYPSTKYHCMLEEILVTAIERFNLSKISKKNEKLKALDVAAKKLCTTMSSGFFNKFCILNLAQFRQDRAIVLSQLDKTLEKL